MGCRPIRFHLMAKRINFLHYLVNLKETELLYKFFNAQAKNPTKGDWILQVLEDLKNLEITSDFNEIKNIKKI